MIIVWKRHVYVFNRLRNLFKRENVVQEASDIQTFFPNDYHPSVEGHTQIAEVIFQSLLKKMLAASCILGYF